MEETSVNSRILVGAMLSTRRPFRFSSVQVRVRQFSTMELPTSTHFPLISQPARQTNTIVSFHPGPHTYRWSHSLHVNQQPLSAFTHVNTLSVDLTAFTVSFHQRPHTFRWSHSLHVSQPLSAFTNVHTLPVQFNSIFKKTLIIPQGAILLWSQPTRQSATIVSFQPRPHTSRWCHSLHVSQQQPSAFTHAHTPSTAFRHLPPNSARTGYVTEGALFISA